jgi:hypothetical protein
MAALESDGGALREFKSRRHKHPVFDLAEDGVARFRGSVTAGFAGEE